MTSTSTSSIRVEPLSGRRQLGQFLKFPARLYQDDPNWVHPLLFEQRQRVSPGHPGFGHMQWQPWLARRDGQIVGRLSAQFDALYSEIHGENCGFFGFYEAENDPEVGRALFAAAESWLRERGVSRVRGPFNLSINAECGLLVDGFDTPPSMMMGHARPYYDAQLKALGYATGRNLLAYHINPDFDAPSIMTRLAQRAAGRVTVRSFDRSRQAEEFELLRDIFNDAWAANWSFLPFTSEEFDEIGHTVTMLVGDDFIQIAELEGQAVAFIIAMPNINEILSRMNGRLLPLGWLRLLWGLKVRYPQSARVPLMGVRRAHQHTRLGPALAFMVIDAVRQAMIRKGIRTVELSWILEDNSGMRNIIESIGGIAYKTYRIYEKQLDER